MILLPCDMPSRAGCEEGRATGRGEKERGGQETGEDTELVLVLTIKI